MKKITVMIALIVMIFTSACQKEPAKVLFIFSYHPEYEWVVEETQGALKAFQNQQVSIEKFYMDTKRNTSKEWMDKVSGEAIDMIMDYQPDVVIVFDDNACRLVARKFIGDELPFVFCGMNADPSDYGFPASNITGVLEREFWAESFDLVKELAPGTETVAILMDSSATALKAAGHIMNIDPSVGIDGIYTISYFDEWKAKVEELQGTVDAIGLFVYFTIKDRASGQALAGEDILNWTLKNNHLPEFAILDFSVKAGALCGSSETGFVQGNLAAKVAQRILDGENPADIPITTPQNGIDYINAQRAQQLGITIPEHLLENAEIIK